MYGLMLVCLIAATLLFIVWVFLFFKYKKQYQGMVDGIDGKIFTLKDIYFIGLGAIEIYEQVKQKKISISDKALEKTKQLAEVFGRDSAELYYYITVAAKVSLILTVLPIGLLLVCMMQSIMGLVLGALLTYALVYGIQSSINASVERKKDAIMSEFPKMVSKLTLLINAGMLVGRAWNEVANSNNEDTLYEEMRFTSKDLDEGIQLEAAMESFATRCGIKEMRKFSSIYVQAVNMGAGEAIDSMKLMADEAWEQKKQISKQKGEVASQKLMIPNLIMFLGILLVVVVPMFASMFGSFSSM